MPKTYKTPVNRVKRRRISKGKVVRIYRKALNRYKNYMVDRIFAPDPLMDWLKGKSND